MVFTCVVQTESEYLLRPGHFSDTVVLAGMDVQKVTSVVVMYYVTVDVRWKHKQ